MNFSSTKNQAQKMKLPEKNRFRDRIRCNYGEHLEGNEFAKLGARLVFRRTSLSVRN